MKEQDPQLRIPEHIVWREQEKLRADTSEMSIVNYIVDATLRMQKKQPSMYKEIKENSIKRGKPIALMYLWGAALSFNIIDAWLQEEGKEIAITEDNLNVHWENVADFWDDQRWNDPMWSEEQLAAGNTPKSKLSLSERLDAYSPSLISLIGTISASLPTYDLKSGFISGARDVALPFFAKIEAEELDKKLYQ